MTLSESIRRAIAIGYDADSDRAPKVMAKGLGPIADSIVKIAEEHGIRIHEDPLLARSLYVLELGQEIPEDFYVALAEILAFIYRTEKRMKGKSTDR